MKSLRLYRTEWLDVARPAERRLTQGCDPNHIHVGLLLRNSTHKMGTGKANAAMEKSDLDNYQPRCMLSHDLINKMTVIIGACEILKDKTHEDAECLKRLMKIEDVAKSIARDLKHHRCGLDAGGRQDGIWELPKTPNQ